MKSAEKWIDEHSQSGPFDLIDSGRDAILLVEAIQKDAVLSIDNSIKLKRLTIKLKHLTTKLK